MALFKTVQHQKVTYVVKMRYGKHQDTKLHIDSKISRFCPDKRVCLYMYWKWQQVSLGGAISDLHLILEWKCPFALSTKHPVISYYATSFTVMYLRVGTLQPMVQIHPPSLW